MGPDCGHFQSSLNQFDSRADGIQADSSACLSNIQVGQCSCEVPKRKRRKVIDEEGRAEAWEHFIRYIGSSPCILIFKEKHVTKQRANYIPRLWHNRAKKLDFLRPSLVHVVTVVSGCPKSLGEGGGPKEGQPRRAHAGS